MFYFDHVYYFFGKMKVKLFCIILIT